MTESENARMKALYKENDDLRTKNKEMRHAMSEFVYRVEAREVRSTYTYELFKKVLKK